MRFAFAIGVVLICGAATSFREPTSLSKLAGTADVIAVGTVADVEAERYVLRVDRTLRGTAEAPTVTVAQPRRSPTEPRWAPYAKGQTLLVFLVRSAGGAPWQIAGVGGDGEMPLDEHDVYLVGHYVEGLPLQSHDLYDASVPAQRLARAVALDAFASYSDCFAWSATPPTAPPSPRQLCADERLAAYRLRSPLHRLLADETRSLIAH